MAQSTGEGDQAGGRYAWYVLGVLVLVYVLNFVDRSIISILANDIKRDLNLDDSDLAFLYGTAFGVFYALFGLPLGKLADSWNRTRLLTLGLALWSTMTTLSGFAKTGGMLAAARVGVGIGEASASPSAYSLISDWFPKHMRATALAIYASGLYLGGGISLLIGAQVVERWNVAWPNGDAPLGLAGWQAAFMVVGLPGLFLALWVSTLREPMRGRVDGIFTPPVENPFRDFFRRAARHSAAAHAIQRVAIGQTAISDQSSRRWCDCGHCLCDDRVDEQHCTMGCGWNWLLRRLLLGLRASASGFADLHPDLGNACLSLYHAGLWFDLVPKLRGRVLGCAVC